MTTNNIKSAKGRVGSTQNFENSRSALCGLVVVGTVPGSIDKDSIEKW